MGAPRSAVDKAVSSLMVLSFSVHERVGNGTTPNCATLANIKEEVLKWKQGEPEDTMNRQKNCVINL